MYTGYKELLLEQKDKILVIKFNNPKRKNAVNGKAYQEITRAMRTVSHDEAIVLVVFTGVGDFFTAGNDLTQAPDMEDMESYAKASNLIFKEMVRSIIDCTKITIALVNGPAIGIGATLAGICDMVWCADTAYFLTPFTPLGLCPEACSSYLFPLIVGRSKASEMLLFNEKLTAAEAYRYKFVSRVFKLAELDTVVWPKLKEYSELPQGSLLVSKKLLRFNEKNALYQILDAECDELYKRLFTEECLNAMVQFAMRKNKAKL